MNDEVCYICKSKNVNERMKSTSGGIAYEIYMYYHKKYNAYIVGAVFDSDFQIKHILSQKEDDIKKMQGSKYPQSKSWNLFAVIKDLLDKEESVVFIGTPCQVAAISSFLGRDYEKLLLVDLICYGTASPGVWKDYVSKCLNFAKIENIVFKEKSYGWKNWNTMIQYKKYRLHLRGRTNIFMKSFMNGILIRPYCKKCTFKGKHRFSDLTIGDAWGEGEKSSMNDDRGLSIAILHSDKAIRLFEERALSIEKERVDLKKYIEGNPYYSKCPDFSNSEDIRSEFFSVYRQQGVKEAFNTCCISKGIKKIVYWCSFIKGIRHK